MRYFIRSLGTLVVTVDGSFCVKVGAIAIVTLLVADARIKLETSVTEKVTLAPESSTSQLINYCCSAVTLSRSEVTVLQPPMLTQRLAAIPGHHLPGKWTAEILRCWRSSPEQYFASHDFPLSLGQEWCASELSWTSNQCQPRIDRPSLLKTCRCPVSAHKKNKSDYSNQQPNPCRRVIFSVPVGARRCPQFNTIDLDQGFGTREERIIRFPILFPYYIPHIATSYPEKWLLSFFNQILREGVLPQSPSHCRASRPSFLAQQSLWGWWNLHGVLLCNLISSHPESMDSKGKPLRLTRLTLDTMFFFIMEVSCKNTPIKFCETMSSWENMGGSWDPFGTTFVRNGLEELRVQYCNTLLVSSTN